MFKTLVSKLLKRSTPPTILSEVKRFKERYYVCADWGQPVYLDQEGYVYTVMGKGFGTYFDSEEEAQELSDKYNKGILPKRPK